MGRDTAAPQGYHHGSHDMDRDEPHGLGDALTTVDPKTRDENSEENKEYNEGYDEGKDDKAESDAKEEAEEKKDE